MPPHTLSKTSFLKFEQCQKAFYFYKNLPFFKDPVSADRQLAFARGHMVGNLARELFPGGIDVSGVASDQAEALALTAQHIADGTPVIYEATFMHDQVLVMVDILCLEPQGYVAYEVKSALRVSEVFLRDACLQYYVLRHVLSGFTDMFLVTMNPDYVRSGDLNCRQLFRKRSIRDKGEEHLSYFKERINDALLVIEENKIPNIPVGTQCFRPYQCDYFGICWKEELNPGSVFHMPHTNKERQFEWHRSGIRLIEQVPDEMLGKESLLRIKNSFVRNEPFFDAAAISGFVSRVSEPFAAMDMEVWSPAVPAINGTRPFEQVPFLVGFYDGTGENHFFAEHRPDERRAFAEALVRLSEPYKSILVYDRNLELSVIAALHERFPEFALGLDSLRSKLVDIFDVFLHMHYYHPAFKNSFSLKVTSSALLHNVDYGEIGSGLEAMNYFEKYRNGENPIERQLLYDELVHYCITDCRATHALFVLLSEIASPLK